MINGFGLGHVYRCLPVIKLLEKRYDVSVSSFGKPYSILIEEGYVDTYELPAIGEVFATREDIDISKSLWQNIKHIHPFAIKKITDIMLETKPDLVIVDGYILGVFVARMLRKKVISIANCTNLWYVFPKMNEYLEKGSNILSRTVVDFSNKILVPDFSPPFTVSANNLLYYSPAKFMHTGPTYLVKGSKKKDTVFISMGGSNVKGSIKSNVLEKWVKDIGYDVIVGDGSLSRKDTEKAISSARAIITHGGHTTLMTAISANTPIIAIPTRNYTERINNAKGIEKIWAGITLDQRWICQENLEIELDIVNTGFIRERVRLLSRIAHKNRGDKKVALFVSNELEK